MDALRADAVEGLAKDWLADIVSDEIVPIDHVDNSGCSIRMTASLTEAAGQWIDVFLKDWLYDPESFV